MKRNDDLQLVSENTKPGTALITGITGQDGAYLARFLLAKGYTVYGTYRRASTPNFWRLDDLGIRNHPRLKLLVHDLTDPGSCFRLLETAKPTEIYHLAAQSHVGVSFEQPVATGQITGLGSLHLLEAIRMMDRNIRYYQASSAEMFGRVQAVPQSETTPFYPRSPYGAAKLYAHWMAINYRESYGIFASCGILFNHESPLRGLDFVTRKITDAVARIALGDPNPVRLGNLNAQRDWGYSPEYVAGMWSMLQAREPLCLVFATNKTHTVRSFVTWAFQLAGRQIEWSGSGAEEIGRCARSGATLVEIAPDFYRPAEVDHLIGDPSKAKQTINWAPTTSAQELCRIMLRADLERHHSAARPANRSPAFQDLLEQVSQERLEPRNELLVA